MKRIRSGFLLWEAGIFYGMSSFGTLINGCRPLMIVTATTRNVFFGSSEGDGEDDRHRQNGLLLKTRTRTKKPAMYKVLLLNDDYTPMEFVVHILERFFSKNRQEATDIMMHVHRRGVGVCGIFTYEIAETKVQQVMDFARANEQPLQCTMEKE